LPERHSSVFNDKKSTEMLLKQFMFNSDLKLHKFGAALADCNQVLEAEPLNVKALFRRGVAHQNKNNYEQVYIIFIICI
jgi:hypothetical protein